MSVLLVDVRSKGDGRERWGIKIKRRFNKKPNIIEPDLSCKGIIRIKGLIVGRHVTNDEIEKFMVDYLRRIGVWSRVIEMRMQLM